MQLRLWLRILIYVISSFLSLFLGTILSFFYGGMLTNNLFLLFFIIPFFPAIIEVAMMIPFMIVTKFKYTTGPILMMVITSILSPLAFFTLLTLVAIIGTS